MRNLINPTWPKEARVQRKNLGRYNPHYGAFKPIFDLSFDDYDNILFCDTDVVPVDICNENIFDEFTGDLGICEEWMQHTLYRDDIGRPRVFNSGVVLYSKKCRQDARKALPRFEDYTKLMARSGLPPFYQGDQNYLNAMLPLFDWQLMDYKWNSQIFFKPDTNGDNRPINDYREQPCFVHVQLRGADHYDIHRLRKVVND